MIETLIEIAVFILVWSGLFLGLHYLGNRGHRWIHDRNPYVRTCRKCGLIENQYTNYTSSWWEAMNRIDSGGFCKGREN